MSGNAPVLPEVDKLRRRLDSMIAKKEVVEAALDKSQKELENYTAAALAQEKARALIQEAAVGTQRNLEARLSTIVTMALKAVFGDEYTFEVQFDTKRGRTECLLLVKDREGNLTNPMDAHGGGLVDVVSFALRTAFWSITQTRPLMILDEPLKFLSRDLVPRAADVIKKVSAELHIQVIMVSHIQEFIESADKAFVVEQESGKARVTEKYRYNEPS